EGDGRLVAAQQASSTAAEGDRLVVAALGLSKHVPHETADDQEEDEVREADRQQQVRRARLFGVEVDMVVTEDGLELVGVAVGRLVMSASDRVTDDCCTVALAAGGV